MCRLHLITSVILCLLVSQNAALQCVECGYLTQVKDGVRQYETGDIDCKDGGINLREDFMTTCSPEDHDPEEYEYRCVSLVGMKAYEEEAASRSCFWLPKSTPNGCTSDPESDIWKALDHVVLNGTACICDTDQCNGSGRNNEESPVETSDPTTVSPATNDEESAASMVTSASTFLCIVAFLFSCAFWKN